MEIEKLIGGLMNTFYINECSNNMSFCIFIFFIKIYNFV